MKKILLVLSMVACIFCLTACGNDKKVDKTTAFIKDEDAITISENIVASFFAEADTIVQQDLSQLEAFPEYSAIVSAVESWKAAKQDMGNYISIESSEVVSITNEMAIVNVKVNGSKKMANIEIMLNSKTELSGFSITVEYTFADQMKKAGLNTLLGMGTVFGMLILISLIIACFGLIPKLQKAFEKKEKPSDMINDSLDNTIAQIIEKEECNLTDDLELVAVIAAAIAASNGATSTDGFVVRSIKRANTNKWQRA